MMLCSNRASLSCSSNGVLRDFGPFAIQTGSVGILFPRKNLARQRALSGTNSGGARTFLSARCVANDRRNSRTGMSALHALIFLGNRNRASTVWMVEGTAASVFGVAQNTNEQV